MQFYLFKAETLISYHNILKMTQETGKLPVLKTIIKSSVAFFSCFKVKRSLTVNDLLNWIFYFPSDPHGSVMTKLRSSRRRSQRKQLNPGLHLPPSHWKSLPPLLPPSLLPPLLTVYQVHHPLTPHFALENSATLTHTHKHTQTLSAHARQHLVSEIRNLRHQRVRLLSPCYLAWTTWPRVKRGARERREEEWKQE